MDPPVPAGPVTIPLAIDMPPAFSLALPVLTTYEPESDTVDVPVSIDSDPLDPAAVAPEAIATEPVPAAPVLSAELIAIAPLATESLPPDRT